MNMKYVEQLDKDPGNAGSDRRIYDVLYAASPIVKQPATLPFRVVLYLRGDQYIIHDELFLEDKSYYKNGDYFTATKPGFVYAFLRWAERVDRQAKSSQSILRDSETTNI